MKQTKTGIGASDGIAIEKVFLIKKPNFTIKSTLIKDVDFEIKQFHATMEKSKQQILNIKDLTSKKLGKENAAIFDAHIQILEDPIVLEDITNMIIDEKMNAAFAIDKIYGFSRILFEQMDDDYFKERAADVDDVRVRLLANLFKIDLPDILAINEKVIIVATDLTPSETALLNKDFVKGFLVDIGGRTSHAAIMARTMEIPAVLGLENITSLVKNGDIVAMNGKTGNIEIRPVDIKMWKLEEKNNLENIKNLKSHAHKKGKTLDGKKILIEANIGKPNDVDNLTTYGAEGVGLYRSEFLYMENTKWPTEEEQFIAYKYVLEKNNSHLTVVRTLDIGGDKTLPYFKFPHEMNPFLGYRAIRLCLDQKDIFKVQLRALGRASAFGQLGIMFPMIATINEFLEAKKITLETFEELKKEGHKISNDIQIGMMIEVPSSAVLASQFANHADFFSIGTNDLIQYSFAVDRMSQKIKYLYQPNNPSLLNLIKLTIEGAKNKNCWVGMCGEMAGDILSIPLLLGLGDKGLDALSMSASSIPKAKYIISQLNSQDCYKLAAEAVKLETEEQVNNLVLKFFKKHNINIE